MKQGTELPCWSHNASVQHMLENHCCFSLQGCKAGTSTACTGKASLCWERREKGCLSAEPSSWIQPHSGAGHIDVLCRAATPAPKKAWLDGRVPLNKASHAGQHGGRDSPHPPRSACRAELISKMPCGSLEQKCPFPCQESNPHTHGAGARQWHGKGRVKTVSDQGQRPQRSTWASLSLCCLSVQQERQDQLQAHQVTPKIRSPPVSRWDLL